MGSMPAGFADAVLAPGRTRDQLREEGKITIAVMQCERGLLSVGDAAKHAHVPTVWLLSALGNASGGHGFSDVDLARDAQRFVAIDPDVLSGTPCLKGTRVPVHDIADMVANGDTVADLLSAFPVLTEGQIHAACAYAKIRPRRSFGSRKPSWRSAEPYASSEVPLADLRRGS